MLRSLVLAVLAAMLACAETPREQEPSEDPPVTGQGVGYGSVAAFGDNPGALDMFRFEPDSAVGAPRPLIVILHGCSQDAADMHANSGWSEVADEVGLLLLYPQQDTSNNVAACFNWFQTSDTQRGAGEVASVMSMVDWMRANHEVGDVYVTGVSAGGFLAMALAAAYPDVFLGVAPMAAGPAACADSIFESTACMAGWDRTPAEWRQRVLDGNGYDEPVGQVWPRAVLWHGDADATVSPTNLDEAVEQWTALHQIDGVADDVQSSGAVEEQHFEDAEAIVRVSRVTLSGMTHGVPVDASEACGAVASYFLDADICAARRTAQLWGLAP